MTDHRTILRLPGPQGTIAITIDDGPNPDTTAAMLEVLEVYGAKANFFALGSNVAAFPELAARIHESGHGLFNHSYDHADFETLDDRGIVAQLEKTETLLRSVRGEVSPPLVRLPYGSGVDTPRVRDAMTSWHEGVVAVQWSMSAKEWTLIGDCRTPSRIQTVVEATVANLARSQDWDRAVILLHDWPTAPGDGMAAKPLAAAFCAALLEQYLLAATRLNLTPVVL